MVFRVDLKIFLMAILFYFTKQIEIYALIILFCFVHEIGHLIAGVFLKMKPVKLEVIPMGLCVSFEMAVEDFNKKIGKASVQEVKKMVVAICGPLLNLFLIIGFMIFKNELYDVELLIYSNIVILLVNILPIYPLDGGKILKSVLHIKYGWKRSRALVNKISKYTMTIITIIGSISIYYFENIAIFLIIAFMWMMVISENKKYDKFLKNITEFDMDKE